MTDTGDFGNESRFRGVPRTVAAQRPELKHLTKADLENLCCELLEEDPAYKRVVINESDGVADHGVDVKGYRVDGGVTAVQCKAVKDFGPAKIRAATNAFLADWESKWKSEGVDKFILAVTIDPKSSAAHLAIVEEEERLKKLDIAYETWFERRLFSLLKPHRIIAGRYLLPEAIDWVCGPGGISAAGLRNLACFESATMARLVDAEDERLKALKRRWNQGESKEVSIELDRLISDGLDTLSDDLIINYLSFAVLVKSLEDSVQATTALSKLQRRYPQKRFAIQEAFIELNQGHSAQALALLTDDDSPGSRSLRAVSLLNLGSPQEALDVLSLVETPGLEERRIKALSYLVTRRVEDAEREIEGARSEALDSPSLKLDHAKVLFYKSVSPLAWPKALSDLLNPIEPRLAETCRDSSSDIAKLREFCQEAIDRGQSPRLRKEARDWLFASYCLFGDESQQAQGFVEQELHSDAPSITILQWAMTYLSALDFSQLRDKLQQLLSADPNNINYSLVLANICLHSGEADEALEVLEAMRVRAETSELESFLDTWIVRALLASGRRQEAANLAQSGRVPSLQNYEEVWLMPDPSLPEAAKCFAETYQRTGDPDLLLDALRTHSQIQDWGWINEHADLVLDTLQTMEALRDVTAAAFNSGLYERCLELLNRFEPLPLEFVPRKVYTLLALRRIDDAREFFPDLSSSEADIEDLRCELVLRFSEREEGDVADLARRFMANPESIAEDFFRLSDLILPVDRELAEISFLRAIELGGSDSDLATAFHLANKIGLEDKATLVGLQERVMRAAQAETLPFYRLVSVEDLLGLIEKGQEDLAELNDVLAQGRCSNHEYFARTGGSLSHHFLVRPLTAAADASPLESRPLYTRNGRRTMAEALPSTPRLNVDLTTLLTLESLGLLRTLSAHFEEVRVTKSLMRALNHDVRELPVTNKVDQRVRQKVNKVRQWLRTQLQAPNSRWKIAKPSSRREVAQGFYLEALVDLLSLDLESNDVLCIDDRFITRYFASEPNTPIVTTYDLLVHLSSTERLSKDQFYRSLLQLRASNHRFLPLTSSELTYWLSAQNWKLSDSSPELETLKRSLSAILVNGQAMQSPDEGGNREWAVLSQYHRAVEEALVRCFSPEQDWGINQERAYWLLGNLYVDITGLRECVGLAVHTDPIERVGTAYGTLLATVFGLWGHQQARSAEGRGRALHWLHETLLHRVDVNSGLARATAHTFTKLCKERSDFGNEPQKWEAYKATVRNYVTELPEALKPHFFASSNFVRTFDLAGLEVSIGIDTPEAQYAKLLAALQNDASHSMELLLLPRAVGMLERYHLQYQEDGLSFGSAFINAAAKLSEQSLFQALSRLSVFPIPIPESIITQIAGLEADELVIILNQHADDAPTPLGRLHRAHLYLLRPEGCFIEKGMAEIRHLSSEQGLQESAAFLTVLAWSLERWTMIPETELPIDFQLAFSWAHAEELFRRFRLAHIDTVHLGTRFQSFRRPFASLALSLGPKSEVKKDVAYLQPHNADRWFLSGLMYAASRCLSAPSEILNAIRDAILLEDQECFHPAFLETVWTSDRLVSWLGHEFIDPLLPKFLPADTAVKGTRSGLDSGILYDLAVFVQDPPSREIILSVLAHLVAAGHPPDWVRQAIEEPMLRSGLASFVGTDDEDLGLIRATRLTGAFSEDGQAEAFEQFLDVVSGLEVQARSASLAIGCVMSITKLPLDPPARLRLLCRRWMKLLSLKPALAPYVNVYLTGLLLELGPENAYPFWPSILKARAMGGSALKGDPPTSEEVASGGQWT